MEVDAFWELIQRSQPPGPPTDPETRVEEQLIALRRELRPIGPESVHDFHLVLQEQTTRANSWLLWAAGYAAAGGMSDDGFEYFRLWLVMQGRAAFDLVIADPDALASLPWDPDGACFDAAEDLAYLAEEVCTELHPAVDRSFPAAVLPGPPPGTPFDDDEHWFAATFPRIRSRNHVSDGGRAVSRPERLHEPPGPARLGRSTLGPALWEPQPAPMPFAPLAPLLAAALFERGQIRHEDRPMLAAHWLADGLGGDAVLELASLRGGEPEVSELWLMALAELGAAPPDGEHAAMVWGAQLVLNGDREIRWLTRLLWPARVVPHDVEVAELIYTIDDTLDWTDRDLTSRRASTRQRAGSARAALDAAVRAMAEGDVRAARHVLDSWRG